jgi:hypothetical protein
VDEGQRPDDKPEPVEERPLGALAVTSFLTVTILVLWFAMYLLNMART